MPPEELALPGIEGVAGVSDAPAEAPVHAADAGQEQAAAGGQPAAADGDEPATAPGAEPDAAA